MSIWTLQGRFGAETWRQAGDRLAPLTIGGIAVPDPADGSLLDRIGARDTLCPHPGLLPASFRFCPDCGAALADSPAPDRSAPWSPPFGGPDGLPEQGVAALPDPDSREEIPMPPSAAIGLAVAGTPSRLLCCDRATGWVWAFSSRTRDWHRLARAPGCASLPRWSWSGAATARGLALPTERGPAWIDLTAAIGATVVSGVEPCEPLGGVVRLGPVLLAPVRHRDMLAVAVLSEAAGDGWHLHAVGGAHLAGQELLSSPTACADTAFWCGPAGQLSVRDTVDGLDARFVSWSDGIAPLRDARPVVGRDGTPHLCCRLDETTLVYEALSAPGQPRGRRIARGYAPGTGHAVFRENARLRLPWDDRAACDYPLPDDCFLHPILDLGEDRFLLALCSDRSRLGAFLGDPLFADAADAPPLVCTLMVSRGPRMLEPLDCVMRAGRASDLSAAIHDGWLLVHGAVENRCHRWVLRDDG